MNLVDLTDYYHFVLLPVGIVEVLLAIWLLFTHKTYVSPPMQVLTVVVPSEQKGGSRGKNRRR